MKRLEVYRDCLILRDISELECHPLFCCSLLEFVDNLVPSKVQASLLVTAC